MAPTNVGTGGGGGGGGTFNPCASYAVAGTTRQGSYDGTNCTYDSAFVSESNPLTVNLRIPRISGVHIFADSLYVGQGVEPPNVAPAGGTGPTLVIEAGNTLAFNASDNILINRGSTIRAEGTANEPITFTGYEDAVARTAGPYDSQLWAGIVINGNGLTNNCDDAQRAAGQCHVLGEGKPRVTAATTTPRALAVLRYVVVKHAGFDVTGLGDELNGVTFNAVGSGTIVENLEIYSGFDDGIEFFGGAVNVTNYVALYVRDDSIDFSDGYVGTVKNALGHPCAAKRQQLHRGRQHRSGSYRECEPRFGEHVAAHEADDQSHDVHHVELGHGHPRSVARRYPAVRRARDHHGQRHRSGSRHGREPRLPVERLLGGG